MDFSLPDTTLALVETIDRWAAEVGVGADFRTEGVALRDMGIFDLVGAATPDAEHQHLNAVCALTAIGRSGLSGPLVENLWAHANGVTEVDTAWFAAPSGLSRDSATLVPFGQDADVIMIGGGGEVVDANDRRVTDAVVTICNRHSWIRADTPVSSFEELAAGRR